MLTFGPYLPDQPGTTVANNVLPRTQKTYGPIGSLSAISDALVYRAQGAESFRDVDGTIFAFCGDFQDLFHLNVAAWDEVSSSSGAYTVATTDSVEFVNYGRVVISVNGHTDAPQAWTMGTSTAFAALGGSPPTAKTVAVINNFVVLGNIKTGGVVYPNRVHWCAIDAPTDWPTIGSADAAAKQSDLQDLPVGGDVMRVTGAIGGSDGAIFCQKAIFRMQYDGPPYVFSILPVEEGRGTLAKNSVVNVGPFAFYLGEEGFYRFTGTQSVPIGNQQVDKAFYVDFDLNYQHRIYGAADPVNHIVAWAYPGVGHSDGRPNRIIWYNWTLERWSIANVEVDLLYDDITIGYTLDELDSFGTMEKLPASLDDRTWIAGQLVLSAFNSDKKLARFTGSNMAATIDTQEADGGTVLSLPHHRMLVNGVRPYIDVSDMTDVTIALKHRDLPGAALTSTTSNAVDGDGMAHYTVSTRYARASISIAAGAVWNHAQGIDIDVSDDGVN